MGRYPANKLRLVCFNNFYYCRYLIALVIIAIWLVCFNNFYYCRYFYYYHCCLQGQYALIISTIVDSIGKRRMLTGQYALIISTIVDLSSVKRWQRWLVCFNNFYYCRFLTLLPPCEPWLVCFNNFYYCRSSVAKRSAICGLVCFNNFYYCRSKLPPRKLLQASML